MTSTFGRVLKKYRKIHNDTLKSLSDKLNISLPFLSSLEIGRRKVTIDVINKIRDLYCLNEKEYNELYIAMLDSNDKVSIELSKMNEAQREVSLAFARKIENADPQLLEKLRKVLVEIDDKD